MRRPVIIDVAVVAGIGGIGGLFAAWGQGWIVGVLVGLAYVLGRLRESRYWLRLERERSRSALESFTTWAEQVLAAAPADLDPEQERYRRALQGRYHEARGLLERLR